MSIMYWTPDIAIGVEQIDNQHKELISRVNRLVEAIDAGKEEEEINRLFGFLEEYTRQHFGDEEALMESSDYPEREQHVAEHQKFCSELKSLQDQSSRDGLNADLRSRFGETVIDWLFDHICECDRRFGKFLRR